MPWTAYNYQVGDEGGAFTNLLDHATVVRILSEGMPGRRGSNPIIPYRDGAYSEPFKFLGAGTILLDVVLRYTNAAGVITHADGAAGHAYENLSALKDLLGWGGRSRRMLRRDVPHQGAVETRIECVAGVESIEQRYRFTFALRMIDGVWRDQALTSDTQASIAFAAMPFAYTIATGGDYEITDPKITLTCVADGAAPSIEQTAVNEKISVAGSFTAADVIVIDLDRDRAITLNGTRYALVTPDRAWWMRLLPDTAALGMELDASSGTWTVLLEYRDKWL
jgi:hypothetical protein